MSWFKTSWILACALLTACAGRSAPGIGERTSMMGIGQRVGVDELVYAHETGSPFVVVIIPEFHHLPACQADVYAALEALEPVTSFIAVEGRIGEVRHDELGGSYLLDGGGAESYRGLADRPLSERRLVARSWAAGGALPTEVGFDLPLSAALLYEAVHQEDVRSQGVEHPEVLWRAHRIAALYQQTGAVRVIPKATIIGARNRIFVRKLRHYGTYLAEEGRDVVPFPVGAAHANDLARRLRRHRVSYAILVHESCIPPG
jgi:hypothetical protein